MQVVRPSVTATAPNETAFTVLVDVCRTNPFGRPGWKWFLRALKPARLSRGLTFGPLYEFRTSAIGKGQAGVVKEAFISALAVRVISAAADYASLGPMRQPFKIHAPTDQQSAVTVSKIESFGNRRAIWWRHCRTSPAAAKLLACVVLMWKLFKT